MTEKRVDRTQPPDPDKPPVTDQTASNAAAGSALTGTGPSTPGMPPPGGQGHVDVTGIVPEGIHIDPDITEGHPGYEESGDSEIIPLEPLVRGESAGQEDKSI